MDAVTLLTLLSDLLLRLDNLLRWIHEHVVVHRRHDSFETTFIKKSLFAFQCGSITGMFKNAIIRFNVSFSIVLSLIVDFIYILICTYVNRGAFIYIYIEMTQKYGVKDDMNQKWLNMKCWHFCCGMLCTHLFLLAFSNSASYRTVYLGKYKNTKVQEATFSLSSLFYYD